MSRRVYTPKSRPNRGANIRIGNCELVDHVDRPLGSANLQKFSIDACGAVSARRVTYGSPGDIARNQAWGRDKNPAFSYDDRLGIGEWWGPNGGGDGGRGGGGGTTPYDSVIGFSGQFDAYTGYITGSGQHGTFSLTDIGAGSTHWSNPDLQVVQYSSGATLWLDLHPPVGSSPPYSVDWSTNFGQISNSGTFTALIAVTGTGAVPTVATQLFTWHVSSTTHVPPVVPGVPTMSLSPTTYEATVYLSELGGPTQNKNGSFTITNIGSGAFVMPTITGLYHSGPPASLLFFNLDSVSSTSSNEYTYHWTFNPNGLTPAAGVNYNIGTIVSPGASNSGLPITFTFNVAEDLQMMFNSFAPNVISPGDPVYVSGENLDNMITVELQPFVWTDGFGKRHMIIDGIEYVEI